MVKKNLIIEGLKDAARHARRPDGSGVEVILAPALTEEAIHRAVVGYLARAARRGVFWTHLPSGEARHPAVGGKLRGLGLKAGLPDLLLIRDGQAYGLELKRERGGRLSPAQRETQSRLREAGMVVATANGLDAAIDVLKLWEMVR